jgi:DNA-binding NarL/FixJ family response regulator
MGNIKVMLVDDHPLFRQGLRRVLEAETDIEVISELDEGTSALSVARQMAPDVLITDINLPGMNGLQITQAVTAAIPNLAVIVLTAFHDEEQVFHAMRAGAAAYFAKDVTPCELVEAIRQAAKGNYIVNARVLDKSQVHAWLVRHFGQAAFLDPASVEIVSPLSPREMEILQQIALGRSNKEIAYYLGISRQTVKNHMTSILRKLAVEDRTQAALHAVRRGWIYLHETKPGER